MPRLIGVNKQIQSTDIAPGAIPKDADAIVGSAGQVSSGLATHDDIQAAHDSLLDGQKLLILENIIPLSSPTPLSIFEKLRSNNGSSVMPGNVNERRGDIFTTPSFLVTLTSFDLDIGILSTISTDPSVIVEVWNTSGGLPTGVPIAESVAIPFSSIGPQSFGTTFHNFQLVSPVALLPNTIYAFSVKQTAVDSGGAVVHFGLVRPVLTQGYLDSDNAGSSWITNGNDEYTAFKAFGAADGFTVSKRLIIEGSGYGSQLDGVVTFGPGSDRSIVNGIRFNSTITLNANEIHIGRCWQAPPAIVDDNGTDNSIRLIQEA